MPAVLSRLSVWQLVVKPACINAALALPLDQFDYSKKFDIQM